MFNPLNFKKNPHYGGGVFRRRIRLEKNGDAQHGQVHGSLEDCNHGFQSTIHYKDGLISKIEPQFMRIPFSTCDGAWRPLNQLVGAAVNLTVPELLAIAPPLANCTHLHDLTLLAINHSQRNVDIVQYDVEVTDAEEGISDLRVWRNENDGEQQLIHHWRSSNGQIIWPELLNKNPLFMGFSRWANSTYTGLDNEAAFVLQKGNLVSIGRMLDVEGMTGNRAIDENDATSCFTYSPNNSSDAIRLGKTVRDFTDAPEQLLKFI